MLQVFLDVLLKELKVYNLSNLHTAKNKLLFNRLKTHTDQRLHEEQAGSRSGRSCTEQILILCNISEQSHKCQKTIYINSVDFKKAFDSKHWDTL